MKCPHVTKSELAGDEHGWCVVCLRAELAAERAAHLATRQELSMALAQWHVLVEAAVRATIEACVASVYQTNLQAAAKVSNVDPAPIVARVLGGGE